MWRNGIAGNPLMCCLGEIYEKKLTHERYYTVTT